MKLAIVGSRGLIVNNIEKYILDLSEIDMIISGGAKGIDTCAKEFAINNGIILNEILPDYQKFGRAAPLIRNRQIIKTADKVFVFWDGKSKGTRFVINELKKDNKKYSLYIYENGEYIILSSNKTL